MESKYSQFILNKDVAPNISIGFKLGQNFETYGDCQIMYDLASLTKLFCGILVIKLAELKQLNLDDNVDKYIDCQHSITIRELLMHRSGLNDQMIIIDDTRLQFDYQRDYDLSKPTKYADINYILLYLIINQIGDYQQLLKRYITAELDIMYKPNRTAFSYAPTECRSDRGQVCGQVHDNKAYLMGQVSGHAGLFANLDGLMQFFERLINGDIIDLTYFENEAGPRNLLFEVENSKGQMGQFEHQASFHTGFSGTSVLIDFKHKNYIIILSNRIYPSRKNENIFEFRKQVHNHFYEQSERRGK